MKRFDGPKGHTFGGSSSGQLFQFKYLKVRTDRGFFQGEKTCKLLFVRGTISFYNEKLQILHVGEGGMWNVSM